jgi:hypothetical protein
MYSSYSLLTSVLDGGEWSVSRPGRALAPGKRPPVLLYRRLGGLRAGLDTEARVKNHFASAVDRTPIARSSSPYTDTTLTELPRLLNFNTALYIRCL